MPGQHEVEHDEVRRRRRRDRQRAQPVGGVRRLEAVATQVAEDDLGHGGIVVDDEDAGHARSVGTPEGVRRVRAHAVSTS